MNESKGVSCRFKRIVRLGREPTLATGPQPKCNCESYYEDTNKW